MNMFHINCQINHIKTSLNDHMTALKDFCYYLNDANAIRMKICSKKCVEKILN